MQARWVASIAVLLGAGAFGQANFQVGGGAPTTAIQTAFIDAWERNGFGNNVGQPLGNVAGFGPTGLIQEFPSTANPGLTLALVSATSSGAVTVWQVQGTMFAYYSTVTEATAGYPTYDTATCPALITNSSAACTWQTFSNDYALFVYSAPALAASTPSLSLSDPFYTKWTAAGGIGVLGPPVAAPVKITSKFNSSAIVQQFDRGAIYDVTSGAVSPQVVAVPGTIYPVYVQNGGPQGQLGLPLDDVRILPNGLYQQDFEGGAIQYNAANGVAQLQPPVTSVALSPSGTTHMNVGDTLTVQATPASATGTALTDTLVVWNTSNSPVVQLQASGPAATLKALSGGTAVITATAEGQVSAPLTISVTAQCCTLGEGLPTTAAQQEFQAAVTLAGLQVQLPAASPAVRAGNGYMQQLTGAATSAPYLLTLLDNALSAYIVSGPMLTQYLALGGPAGSLGYPVSSATPGGRQNFQNGALAGSPLQIVSGAILTKWSTLGYETGAAGSPTAAAVPFQTFRGTSGLSQTFQTALIVASTSGPSAGQTYWVSGLILAQYNTAGGPSGNLGAPINDEHNSGALRWQDFEGGYINYAPGATQATLTASPRQPVVSVSPATVVSGGAVHVIAAGFNNAAALRVSQSGQPDFLVTVPNGSYAWDVLVPAAAPNGTVTVTAIDTVGGASAQATYNVENAATATLNVAIASGNQQTGAPGALLANPLVIVVTDSNNHPVPGQTVNFAASQGAIITPSTAVTGVDGKASAALRMPGAAAVVQATATVSHQVAAFSVSSGAFALSNFTPLSQNVSGNLGNGSSPIAQKGALLTSAAAILHYYQSSGALPTPNGPADPLGLNQFLTAFCANGKQMCDGFVTLGANGDQTVNLWRLGAFAGNDVNVSVEATDMNSLRDLVFGGSPVLLALSLNGPSSNPMGSHFVVATGISRAGDLAIADPNPAFQQALLGAYVNGFTDTGGNSVVGTVVGAVRLLPQAPSASAFLVAATAPLAVSSVNGSCGTTLQFPDTAGVSGTTPANPPGSLYFRACAGLDQGPYELDVNATGAYSGTFTVLSTASPSSSPVTGTAGTSVLVVRSGSQWTLAPLTIGILPGGIVNAASFNSQIAPGGLVSIFGEGLNPAGLTPVVQVNGENATILGAFPFQVNAQIPADIAAGAATVSVTLAGQLGSANGSAQQAITVSALAPAIFSIGAGQAAITNQDNSLNTPSNPAIRGSTIVIYGTGLGAVTASGGLNAASTPAAAVIGGTSVPAAFSGLTAGFVGLYQVNVVIPQNLPPGLAVPLYLKQGTAVGNTVSIAVQ